MLANLLRLGWQGQNLLKIGKLVEGRPFHVYVCVGVGWIKAGEESQYSSPGLLETVRGRLLTQGFK